MYGPDGSILPPLQLYRKLSVHSSGEQTNDHNGKGDGKGHLWELFRHPSILFTTHETFRKHIFRGFELQFRVVVTSHQLASGVDPDIV